MKFFMKWINKNLKCHFILMKEAKSYQFEILSSLAEIIFCINLFKSH